MVAIPLNPQRWRAFADAIALALGVNVWLALVVFPGFFVGAWSSRLAVVVALTPLAVLGAGLWRRSEVVLLFAFPTALLLPVALSPDMVALHVWGPIHFAIVALGLVGYLFGASALTSFEEPAPPLSMRPLASSLQPVPARWRRRARVYAYWTAFSIAIPVALLYAINFNDSTRLFIRTMYPGRAASFTAVVDLGMLAFWFVLYGYAFLKPLGGHRTGDRALAVELETIRRSARSRKLGFTFYSASVAALLLLLLLSLLALRSS